MSKADDPKVTPIKRYVRAKYGMVRAWDKDGNEIVPDPKRVAFLDQMLERSLVEIPDDQS